MLYRDAVIQESIPIGCIPLASLAITRYQYWWTEYPPEGCTRGIGAYHGHRGIGVYRFGGVSGGAPGTRRGVPMTRHTHQPESRHTQPPTHPPLLLQGTWDQVYSSPLPTPNHPQWTWHQAYLPPTPHPRKEPGTRDTHPLRRHRGPGIGTSPVDKETPVKSLPFHNYHCGR